MRRSTAASIRTDPAAPAGRNGGMTIRAMAMTGTTGAMTAGTIAAMIGVTTAGMTDAMTAGTTDAARIGITAEADAAPTLRAQRGARASLALKPYVARGA